MGGRLNQSAHARAYSCSPGPEGCAQRIHANDSSQFYGRNSSVWQKFSQKGGSLATILEVNNLRFIVFCDFRPNVYLANCAELMPIEYLGSHGWLTIVPPCKQSWLWFYTVGLLLLESSVTVQAFPLCQQCKEESWGGCHSMQLETLIDSTWSHSLLVSHMGKKGSGDMSCCDGMCSEKYNMTAWRLCRHDSGFPSSLPPPGKQALPASPGCHLLHSPVKTVCEQVGNKIAIAIMGRSAVIIIMTSVTSHKEHGENYYSVSC